MEVAPATLPGKFGALCVLELSTADGAFDGEPELQKLAWSVEQSSDAVVISDADGVIHYVNPAFEAMTGFARSEVLGRTPRIVKSGHHSADFYRGMWGALRSGVEFRGVLINRKKSGELFHEEKVIRPFFGPDGRVTHFVSIGRDVTDRIREMEDLTRAATHDSLTDLPNRRLFFDRLGQALRQAARRGTGLAVAVVDVDRFKAINDLHGHLAGDAVLQGVASRLQRCVREEDTVARLGGDEFGLILLDAADPAVVAALLEKILRSIAVPLAVDDHAIAMSVSIGASLSRADEGDGRELMQRADEAMYRAKRAGGNCYRLGVDAGSGRSVGSRCAVSHGVSENQPIAEQLREFAGLLQAQGANPFRVSAYRKAADAVQRCEQPVREMFERDGRDGTATPVRCGTRYRGCHRRDADHRSLESAAAPAGQRRAGNAAAKRAGHRARTCAGVIHETLHVDTLEALEIAANDGRLESVPGVGPRRAQMIRAALAAMLGRRSAVVLRRDATAEGPPVATLLAVDREYRERAEGRSAAYHRTQALQSDRSVLVTRAARYPGRLALHRVVLQHRSGASAGAHTRLGGGLLLRQRPQGGPAHDRDGKPRGPRRQARGARARSRVPGVLPGFSRGHAGRAAFRRVRGMGRSPLFQSSQLRTLSSSVGEERKAPSPLTGARAIAGGGAAAHAPRCGRAPRCRSGRDRGSHARAVPSLMTDRPAMLDVAGSG